ncbi:MAG: HU family DNA-binding protein [Alphaproteobacteria bacterium]
MTKSDLIKILAKKYPAHSIENITNIVNIIFSELANALINKNKVELRRFGSFSVRKRESRVARNPRTSADIKIEERFITYFRMGKEFKDIINSAN